ncbi:MAG TPA: M20 family metallopeptidase [Candidatus Binatia bacterium]|jgi:hippurate hydrolase|nr:M20 family metallopeptidase [Candidatus Binatia bacterium]
MLDDLRRAAADLLPDCVALRRRIHALPELGLDLPETQRAVLDALAGVDVEIATGGATSAVVATIHGARPGPTLLLRADMDALPLREATGLPFASTRDGMMHACGHDAHVAMLAMATRLLAARRADLAGTVRCVFQPGEEGHGGARILIEEGLLSREPRVDAAFAIHVDSATPVGMIAGRPGPILAAADVVAIEVRGKGGHASMPHLAVDPVPVACEMVLALQLMITRRIDVFDPAVLTIARIRAGSAGNVIPSSASLMGTLRTVSEETRATMHDGIRRVVAGIAAAHGVEAEAQVIRGYPVTINDDRFAAFAGDTARALVGDAHVHTMPAPVMGAEDFSYVLQQVPGALVFLGAKPMDGESAPLHSDRMRIDESAFATGIALHAAVALRFLEAGGTLQAVA